MGEGAGALVLEVYCTSTLVIQLFLNKVKSTLGKIYPCLWPSQPLSTPFFVVGFSKSV